MYKVNDEVWAIIYPFDTPKKCVVADVNITGGSFKYVEEYIVKYNYKLFKVRNVDVYPTKIDADIYWAVCIQEDYANTLKHKDIFLTDDYERANMIATKLLSEYADKIPHILIKYL